MTLTITALSFLLLSSGLACCGWRFLAALRQAKNSTGLHTIGRLLSALFFLSATYNGIIGLGSLFFSKSPNGLFIIAILAHLLLTALALVSVFTVYYIFWPKDSARLLLGTLGMTGSAGTLFYLTAKLRPFVTTEHSINWNLSPGLALLTFCLLTISLLATLYIFAQLFRKTNSRSLKTLSLIFSALSCASVLYAIIKLATSLENNLFFGPLIDWAPWLLGASFLVLVVRRPAMRATMIIFLVFLGWWASFYFGSNDPTVNNANIYISAWFNVYTLLALWGVWCGFKIAKKQGGFRNDFGKSIGLFTLGLLCQVFGQVTFGLYNNVLNVALPYPSLADLAYIASPIIYLLALVQFGRAAGINWNLKLMRGKISATGFFIGLLSVYWAVLLWQGYAFDLQQPIKIILDLAYPLLETLFLAVGILVYRSYRKTKISSPLTKIRFVLILAALGMQYLADAFFSFLVQSNKWSGNSFGDLPYFLAYFLMTVAIIHLGDNKKPVPAQVSQTEELSPGFYVNPGRATGFNPFSNILDFLKSVRITEKA